MLPLPQTIKLEKYRNNRWQCHHGTQACLARLLSGDVTFSQSQSSLSITVSASLLASTQLSISPVFPLPVRTRCTVKLKGRGWCCCANLSATPARELWQPHREKIDLAWMFWQCRFLEIARYSTQTIWIEPIFLHLCKLIMQFCVMAVNYPVKLMEGSSSEKTLD